MLTRSRRLRAKPRPGWVEKKAEIRIRSGDRCEVVLDGVRCLRIGVDCHHIIKRSQGGPDETWNLISICRRHHERTDAPLYKGRLTIEPRTFACRIVQRHSKWAWRDGDGGSAA